MLWWNMELRDYFLPRCHQLSEDGIPSSMILNSTLPFSWFICIHVLLLWSMIVFMWGSHKELWSKILGFSFCKRWALIGPFLIKKPFHWCQWRGFWVRPAGPKKLLQHHSSWCTRWVNNSRILHGCFQENSCQYLINAGIPPGEFLYFNLILSIE